MNVCKKTARFIFLGERFGGEINLERGRTKKKKSSRFQTLKTGSHVVRGHVMPEKRERSSSPPKKTKKKKNTQPPNFVCLFYQASEEQMKPSPRGFLLVVEALGLIGSHRQPLNGAS